MLAAASSGVLALAGLVAATTTTVPPAAPAAGGPIPMEQSAIFPAPTGPPDGIGDSPIFNALAAACYGGAMNACRDLYGGAPYDSQYESYGRTCAGRQPSDSFDSCSDLLVTRLAQTPYTPTATVVQPGDYFGDQLTPGIYVSGPIAGESCSWTTRDQWGYTTNDAYVSSEGLSQAVTAVMVLPTDASLELDGDCGPVTLVEQWTR